MEIQLQELIEQIKRDGVESAEARAAEILDAANAEAQKIVADAKKNAEEIMQKAKAENDRFVRVGEDALKQAARNLLISFRESIARELNVIIGEKVSTAYSNEALSKLIVDAVAAFAQRPDIEDVCVLLGAENAEALENALLSALKARMLEGVTVKPRGDFDGGFRIAVNGGSAYYDYSSEAVSDMLSAYLAPKVTALLKEAQEV